MKSVNDIMPMIGARFYTQLDAAQVKCDVLEGELAKVTKRVLAKWRHTLSYLVYFVFHNLSKTGGYTIQR